MTDWAAHAAWWREQLSTDSSYEDLTKPLIESLLPFAGPRLLDLGCGEGRIARHLQAAGREIVGLDRNPELAADAGVPAFVAELPYLDAVRNGSFDGAYVVLVLEHIADLARFFYETARVVRSGGVLAALVNHPVITAPGATTVVDPTDGEVFWRWGSYFEPGTTTEVVTSQRMEFHHRSMADLLTAAAESGWLLDELIEQPGTGEGPVEKTYAGIPILAGIRWLRA